MGKLRTALVALTEYADSPGELLTRLDRFLAQNRTTEFATVCYGVLDPATGVFEYAWAGHPPMVLVTPAGDIRWLDEGGSPPLSAEGERARPHASIVLEAGSFLVLYSDGLVERRGEPLERGLDRLAHACERLVDMPIESICDHLVSALGVESARDDDVAVLAVRLDAVPTAVFRRVFPARAEELHGLRAAMRAWLSERRVGEPEQKALMLAVGEACANAIEHAYRGSDPGDVSVEIGEGGQSSLEVAVRDFGRFRFGPNAEERGRGSAIIRGLTTDFTRESTGEGTTVRFRLPVDRQVVSV
jgi:anti-sigma regulatory factor (Ser/Thr protein kinase)